MKRLNAILSAVLQIDVNQITDETSPSNVQTWDSFNGLLLVSEIESKFGVNFTMDEVASVKCVGDIKESLKKHGVDFNESN